MAGTLRTLASACLAILLAGAPRAAEATQYGLRASEAEARVSRDLVAGQLLTELTAALGHGSSHERLLRFQGLMRPMYMALPKNSDGGIDQGTARYALHRYLLSQHGWHIRGLASEGERWKATSSTKMLKSKMPSLILDLLEQRVGSGHIGLQELAVLAATVEDLVHGDTIDILRMAYETHKPSVHVPLATAAEEELVIKTYLLYLILPPTQEMQSNSTALLEFLPQAPSAYPGWENTLIWVKDLMEGIQHRERGERRPFVSREMYFRDFPAMVHLAEEIIDGIGMFQNIECKMMKDMLLDLQGQERTDGRVPLDKFWGPFMAQEHHYFTESIAYLKNLGALDDSDSRRPSVIIPNIVYGRSNCLAASSGFHSLCCVNQCEAIMGALEQSIARPIASPSIIVELVAAMPSDSVVAPRNLSGSLRRKIDMIAAQHHGQVPLHGRMFAMWLHHAFPNECPFPLASDAGAPMTREEWDDHRQMERTASDEEMQRAKTVAKANGERYLPQEFDESALQWSGEEELVCALGVASLGSQGEGCCRWAGALCWLLRVVAMSTAGITMLATLWDSLRSSASHACKQKLKGESSVSSLPRWFGAAATGSGTI